ncbi:NCAIR mutase-like protein [Synechococcus sp. PCC 7502]|uniref:nickel pincer cofactor biosynthesis protein LarB n=1 Tax=Synechococcus sp. PCC 7502 TaxID=1173263 RepID=UPI00029FFF67|nr:nickel pincer cofactor biosynthesis protein LarB [Synechococcus sp. PCC 7502]AFY73650.1 NCAIR mutase-like protein [Synechococcus sp. PCC 7502]
MSENLSNLLQAVAIGEISPQEALQKLQYLNFEPVSDFAKIDHHRSLRTGFPEVVFGLGKTPDQIIAIMKVLYAKSGQAIATKISSSVHSQIQPFLPDLQYSAIAQICYLGEVQSNQKGKIAIISAGTADLPIAEEAALTAELCGFTVQRLWDVGVAGIHRLWQHQHLLTTADVLIVVAGMEGALPSVVAGLVSCPVIAVPASVGYGANFNGIAPLLTMLNSCATGIGVVNIDNGFGAAILAGKILKLGK